MPEEILFTAMINIGIQRIILLVVIIGIFMCCGIVIARAIEDSLDVGDHQNEQLFNYYYRQTRKRRNSSIQEQCWPTPRTIRW